MIKHDTHVQSYTWAHTHNVAVRNTTFHFSWTYTLEREREREMSEKRESHSSSEDEVGVCRRSKRMRLESNDFEKDGFEVFKEFLSKTALSEARSRFERIYAEKHEDIDHEWVIHLHLDQIHGSWVRKIACHPKLVAHLRKNEHFGPKQKIYLYCSQLSTKRPGGKCAHVPWHQDGDGTVRTVWIALDDISGENGGLVVVRGGHKAGRQSLKHVTSEAELPDAIRHAKYNVFAIQDKDIVKQNLIYEYNLPAGGAGIHHPLLPHMSYRNTTNKPRRVLILRYTTDKDEHAKDATFLHYRTLKPTPKRSLLVECHDTTSNIAKEVIVI